MTRRRVRAALGWFAGVASLAVTACGGATNWWMFQGDLGHSGRNPRLNSRQPHTLRWNVPLVPGPPQPTPQLTQPVFGNAKILIASGDGKLFALWPTDGSTLWTFTAPAGTEFYGSAAAVDDRVYAATYGPSPASSPQVYALDESTGAVVWQTPLPGGTAASIAVAGGLVFVHAEQQHRLYALNAGTGGIVWSMPLSPGTLATSSSAPAVAFGRVFVGSDDGLFAFNFATGAQMWKFPLASPSFGSSPVVYAAPTVPLVYINTSGLPGISSMLHAVNAATGAQVWSYTAVTGVGGNTSAVADGRLFIFDYLTVKALDAVTGAPLWAYTPPPVPGAGLPMLAPAVGDRLVYYSDRQMIRGLDMSTGKLVWDAPIPGNSDPNAAGNSPGIEFELLVVPNKGHVHAFR